MPRVLPFARVGLGALLPSSLTPPLVNLIPTDAPRLAPEPVVVVAEPVVIDGPPLPPPSIAPSSSGPNVDTVPSTGMVPYVPPNTNTVTDTGQPLTPSLGMPALPMWAWLAIGAVVWLMLGDNRKR